MDDLLAPPVNDSQPAGVVTPARNKKKKNLLRSGLAFASRAGKTIGRTTQSAAEKAKKSAHSVARKTAELSKQTSERTKTSAATAKNKFSKFDEQVNFTGAVMGAATFNAAGELVYRKNVKGCAKSLSVAGAAYAAKNNLRG